jgi:solute carrier family 25 carnitine/acylcarnitine transporter 20/29
MSDDESENKKIDPFKNFLAGGVGGVCLIIIGHPPDTIKVRLQTMPKPKKEEKPMYTGAIDCVKKTVRKEVCSLCYLLN